MVEINISNRDFINQKPIKVLLVTQNQNTLNELSSFNLVLATNAITAALQAEREQPSIVIWDLGAPPIETNIPLYKWNKDLFSPQDIDRVLKDIQPPEMKQNLGMINKPVARITVVTSVIDINELKLFKNKVLVDTVGILSQGIEESHIDLWKSDWRIPGVSPYRLEGVLFYPLTEALGILTEHDRCLFTEFIEQLLRQKPDSFVIDNGTFTEELLRLGAVAI